MILVDTGPLVAAANRNDTHHRTSTEALAAAPSPRLVPGMVIAEVGYLLARDAGSSVEAEVPAIVRDRVPRCREPHR
ncbi:MAG TPA: PIN domain-containing protein [Solirubrobacteraceae bacterium]|jgi:hypothetical protein